MYDRSGPFLVRLCRPTGNGALRRVKCPTCGGEWRVRALELDAQRCCPFCCGAIERDVPSGAKDMEISSGILVKYTGREADVHIPAGVILIGPNAFAANKTLQTVTFSDDVVAVGAGAFNNCRGLREVNLGERVVRIEDMAFFNCDTLVKISFPKDLNFIGMSAFSSCSKLETLSLPYALTEISAKTFYKCTGLRAIALPTGLKEIGREAFSHCAALESVTLPASLKTIDAKAFAHCRTLDKVLLSKKTEIEPTAFDDALPTLYHYGTSYGRPWRTPVPEKALTYTATLGEYDAYSAVSHTFTIPDGYTRITKAGLEPHAQGMRTLRIPASVTEIDDDAFVNCRVLTKVYVSSKNEVYEVRGKKLVERGSGRALWPIHA